MDGDDSAMSDPIVIRGTNGDDLLFGNQKGNLILGFGGNDRIAGETGDDVVFGGAGNDKIGGNCGTDWLFGEDGNDYLNGGPDADHMFGGSGNDVYLVDNVGDVVTELTYQVDIRHFSDLSVSTVDSGGIDVVRTSVDYALSANVEKLVLLSGAINGTGNELDNSIKGNNSANDLFGLDGKDQLTGGNGTDCLFGGAGDDRLNGGNDADLVVGGTGKDSLTGGAGCDTFVFAAGDTGLVASRDADSVRDFTQGQDLLDVSGADWSFASRGSSTILSLDFDQDGSFDGQVSFVGHIDFTASDFIV